MISSESPMTRYTRVQLIAAVTIFGGIAVAALIFSTWNVLVRDTVELSSSTVEVISRAAEPALRLPVRVKSRLEAREGKLLVYTTVRNSDWRWIVIRPPSCGTSLLAENAAKVFDRAYATGECMAVLLFSGEAKTSVAEFRLAPDIDRYKLFITLKDDLTERGIYVSATLVVPSKARQ